MLKVVLAAALVSIFCLNGCASSSQSSQPASSWPETAQSPRLGALIASDDFDSGLDRWIVEAEQPGSIRAADRVLAIDVPAGLTLWFKQELTGPVAIVFDAEAIAAGGPNDRVSDMNTFWMARNKSGKTAPFSQPRTGKFSDYNDLLTYYVGLGGNSNTTTRFRRYIGDANNRPLLPDHDLSSADVLLVPNKRQTIMMVANGSRIEYWRDGVRLLQYQDAEPYTKGWFAIRTVQSHLKIRKLRVYRLAASS